LLRILPAYRWWRPLVAATLAAALYLVASFVWQEAVLAVIEVVGGVSARTDLYRAWTDDQQDASNPLVLLFTLGALATMLPAVLVAVRVLRLGSFGRLASVAGRIRWRWLAWCLIPAAVYMAITIGLGLLVPASWQGQDPSTTADAAATPAVALTFSVVVIILLVPFQAAAEEFAFRGLGLTLFGSWVRSPVLAILLSTAAFMAAHSYNGWGRIDVGALGLAFAYLTWRTGGLEAGIAGHVLNNVVVFLLAAPVVATTQSDGTPIGAAISVVAAAAYVAMVLWLARRLGRARKGPERSAPGPREAVAPISR
jgi:membrane protease YdiL (CAAX protease family)